MTIQEVKNIIGLFYRGYMTPALFCTHYHLGEIALFNQKVLDGQFDSLSRFSVTMGDESDPLKFISGRGDIPSDFAVPRKAYYRDGSEYIPINIVDDGQYERLLVHKIEYPTVEYPIMNIQSDYIRIMPKTIKFVVLTYLKQPSVITYNITQTYGFAEFTSSGSSTVNWDDPADHILLIQNILKSLGIIVNQSEIQSKIQEK